MIKQGAARLCLMFSVVDTNRDLQRAIPRAAARPGYLIEYRPRKGSNIAPTFAVPTLFVNDCANGVRKSLGCNPIQRYFCHGLLSVDRFASCFKIDVSCQATEVRHPLPFGGKFAMLRKCEITEKSDKTDHDDENHAKDQICPVYVKPAKSQTISPPVRNVRNFSEKRCNDRGYVQSKRAPASKIPLNLRDALKKRPGPGPRIMSDRRRQRRS